jgi:hypothetical protein
MTEIHERLRRLPARTARALKQPRGHYLIAGLAVGGLWLLNGDKSLLYHAVQMLIVMSVLTGLQIVLERRHGGTRLRPPDHRQTRAGRRGRRRAMAASPGDILVRHHRRGRPGRPDRGSRAGTGPSRRPPSQGQGWRPA